MQKVLFQSLVKLFSSIVGQYPLVKQLHSISIWMKMLLDFFLNEWKCYRFFLDVLQEFKEYVRDGIGVNYLCQWFNQICINNITAFFCIVIYPFV